MIATTLNRVDWQKLRLNKADSMRGLAAGTAWGLSLAAGLIAMGIWHCGAVSPEDAAFTTAICVGAGMLAIGPLAAFGGRR